MGVVFCFPQVPFPSVIPPAVIESSPPSGTVVCVVFCFPQVPFPPVIPPAVIGSSPPSGTGGLDAALRGLDAVLRGLDAALRRFY